MLKRGKCVLLKRSVEIKTNNWKGVTKRMNGRETMRIWCVLAAYWRETPVALSTLRGYSEIERGQSRRPLDCPGSSVRLEDINQSFVLFLL